MVEVKRKINAPAWISALGTLIVTGIALLALAGSPSEQRQEAQDQQLSDHESRIRALEQVTNQALSRIETQIKGLRRELERRHGGGDG